MNYRHIYHAGNFADVFKHWILTQLLEKLVEKETPFFVLDTHAGLGLYDLQDKNAQKTQEQASGIKKLNNKQFAAEFKSYYKILCELNPDQNFRNYPGSPYICQHFLRSNDRLVLAELHPEDCAQLETNIGPDRRITFLNQNGYNAIKALLPPKEKRGLILIDPPFEDSNEVSNIVNAIKDGIQRFAHGMYAIWYPIKDRKLIKSMYNKLQALGLSKAMYIELHANTQILNQLSSCGMIIINPPWQLAEKLQNSLPKLIENLEFKHATYEIEWLATEN